MRQCVFMFGGWVTTTSSSSSSQFTDVVTGEEHAPELCWSDERCDKTRDTREQQPDALRPAPPTRTHNRPVLSPPDAVSMAIILLFDIIYRTLSHISFLITEKLLG